MLEDNFRQNRESEGFEFDFSIYRKKIEWKQLKKREMIKLISEDSTHNYSETPPIQ